ncbi:MAG TPA: flagellar hook protein FlgE [Lysobacter sp.]
MGFNTSLSGINAANADLNVTANNIANVNTTGFKESRAEFADLFSSTAYGLSRNAIGSGVKLSNVAQQFSQGNIDPTGRGLDVAIDGEGFFTLNDNGARVYTRAGNFQPDPDGYIGTPDGKRLQVFPPNANGNGFDVGRMVDLQLLATTSPPQASTNVDLQVTLPGNATAPTVAPFDPTDTNTFNHSTGGATVYDSLGVAHVQTSYFVKTANANEWQVHNYVDGTAVGAPTTLQFNGSGALVAPANGQIAMAPFTPTTGAGVMNLTLNVSGSAQYGSAFALRDINPDGYAAGKLNEVDIDPTGIVFARFSNGADVPLGQIALTTFTNPQGLQPQGNNTWGETYSSGAPRSGAPDTADFGLLESGSLEASTVDLTEQLVNMITAQRNFQANAQMISTQDQITQTIINIR